MAKEFKAEVFDASRTLVGGISMFWGFDAEHLAKINICREKSFPWFHLDHAYFKRGYENGNFRINYCHFHQTKLLDVPADRLGLATKRLQDWKRTGSNVLVLVPSENISRLLGYKDSKDWVRQVTTKLRGYTDRPLVVKEKGPGLDGYLPNAWAAVSMSSVAEVECAIKGVPVFTLHDSPAAQVSEKDLSKIETPIYPDREPWLRSLSYSQFNVSELGSGKVASILKDIYGIQ